MQRVTCGRQMWPWRTSNAQAQDESFEELRIRQRDHWPHSAPCELNWPVAFCEDVAGIGTAKAEALEIVECLMAPARLQKGERAHGLELGVESCAWGCIFRCRFQCGTPKFAIDLVAKSEASGLRSLRLLLRLTQGCCWFDDNGFWVGSQCL